jgi:hypothetical protein
MASRPRQHLGLTHHALAEVDPMDPLHTWGEGACEESCPACHISDTLPRGGTCHPDDEFQQLLIGHRAALEIVGDLPIKLGAHLRLDRGRSLVTHGDALQNVDEPSCTRTMVCATGSP